MKPGALAASLRRRSVSYLGSVEDMAARSLWEQSQYERLQTALKFGSFALFSLVMANNIFDYVPAISTHVRDANADEVMERREAAYTMLTHLIFEADQGRLQNDQGQPYNMASQRMVAAKARAERVELSAQLRTDFRTKYGVPSPNIAAQIADFNDIVQRVQDEASQQWRNVERIQDDLTLVSQHLQRTAQFTGQQKDVDTYTYEMLMEWRALHVDAPVEIDTTQDTSPLHTNSEDRRLLLDTFDERVDHLIATLKSDYELAVGRTAPWADTRLLHSEHNNPLAVQLYDMIDALRRVQAAYKTSVVSNSPFKLRRRGEDA